MSETSTSLLDRLRQEPDEVSWQRLVDPAESRADEPTDDRVARRRGELEMRRLRDLVPRRPWSFSKRMQECVQSS